MSTRMGHAAGKSAIVTGMLYALHTCYVLWLGPVNERAAVTLWVWPIIASVVLALTLWAGICVMRGGRLVGAALIALFYAAGFAVSSVLAARSMWEKHPPFVLLQTSIFLAALTTLILLAAAKAARDSAGSSADM